MDLNHRPPRYKRGALTTELWALENQKKRISSLKLNYHYIYIFSRIL